MSRRTTNPLGLILAFVLGLGGCSGASVVSDGGDDDFQSDDGVIGDDTETGGDGDTDTDGDADTDGDTDGDTDTDSDTDTDTDTDTDGDTDPMHMKVLQTVFCDDGALVVKPVIDYDDDGDMTSRSAYLCGERPLGASPHLLNGVFYLGYLVICFFILRLRLRPRRSSGA